MKKRVRLLGDFTRLFLAWGCGSSPQWRAMGWLLPTNDYRLMTLFRTYLFTRWISWTDWRGNRITVRYMQPY